ncbi:MAG: MFS transporter [Acidobacteriaceae bacterium]|nr:MFS transporter [Acidobacteriaceae bacterium]
MLLFAAIIAFFVYGLIASMLGSIMPDLSKHFGLTPKHNGIIATAQAVGLILSSALVGPLIDEQGKKAILLFGLALIALTLLLLPNMKRLAPVVLLFFALGIGESAVVASASTLVSDISAGHRGSTLSLTNVFFGLGGFLTPFFAANIFAHNWKRLCRAAGVLTCIVFLMELVTHMPASTGAHFSGHAVFELFSSPLLLLLSVFLLLYTACEVGIWNWLPRFLIAHDVPKAKALNMLSFGFALGLLLGRVVVTFILLHVSAMTVALAGAIGMAITTLLLLHTKKTGYIAAIVFAAGLFMAPIFPTTVAIVGDHYQALSGTAMGLVITAGWVGLALSSPLIGAISGDDSKRLGRALHIIPVASVAMILINLVLRFAV